MTKLLNHYSTNLGYNLTHCLSSIFRLMQPFKSIRLGFCLAFFCLLSACSSLNTGNNGMSHLQITQDTRGVALTSRDSDLFMPGSATLSSNAPPYLNKVAELLKERPHRKVLIDSISENAGSSELNQELQEVRSLTLMKALTDRGIDKSRLAYTPPNAYGSQTGTNSDNQYKTKIIILGESTSEMNVSTIERFFDDLYKVGNNIFN